MNLSDRTLVRLPRAVERPFYRKRRIGSGIVHLGVGAMLRAGIAWYTDAALSRDLGNWAITAVSLRTPLVARRLAAQDGLYALGEQDEFGVNLRVVGAISDVLIASEDSRKVISAIAAPSTRIVSFTVTEAGYCADPKGVLDFDRAHSHSLYYFVTQGLWRRKIAGLPGLTLLSCDDMPNNGDRLRDLLLAYLVVHEPDLVEWFLNECRCPCSAGLRIVLGADDTDSSAVIQRASGLRDRACVLASPGARWFIEDDFVQGRPQWDYGGAQFGNRQDLAAFAARLP